jgi:hypothetical protein
MMGPTKLSTIREHVRKSFKMTDAELLAWFNRQMEEREENPDADTEIGTLRLLRDALKKETNGPKPKRKPRRVPTTKR